MAKAAALLIASLVLPAVAGARGAESDPARRSLVVEAVEKASPAVVNVSTEQIVEQRGCPFPFPQGPFFEEFFRDFVDPRPRRFKTTSLGSGVIVAADGTIMTNVHVVQRASRIQVTLIDPREFDAKLVGADADADIAVLRIKAGGDLPHIPFGSSADLMIGETVIAIGNPFGLSHTVTTGVVSAVGRSLHDEDRTYTDFIQTDASINPGDPAGAAGIALPPRRDGRHQEVGVAAAVFPAARADELAWQLLGVAAASAEDGLVVTRVRSGSPAARIGVQRGDRLLGLGGTPLRSVAELRRKMIGLRGARSVLLSVGRGPYQYNVNVPLARG